MGPDMHNHHNGSLHFRADRNHLAGEGNETDEGSCSATLLDVRAKTLLAKNWGSDDGRR